MQKRLISTVFIIISFGLLLTGCKDAEETVPEASSSEAVSEVISEEVSEEVSEAESEAVASEKMSEEIVEDVVIVNFSNSKELIEYVNGYNKTTIVEYNFSEEGSSQSIIPNGSKYTMQMGNILMIVSIKEVSNVESSIDYITTMENTLSNTWAVYIDTAGTDLEVSFTVNYTDGTSEDFTIYVTVDESM